ncbi:MAG: methyltransferase regulatory domain-containing protein [Planctomycetaceae bacterium]|nr:methyltransferase regulatory domain-containing protein [Planctomycetaceae bacterium]
MPSDQLADSASTNSYDQVPYRSMPFRQAHPDRLATIATLFGLEPPTVETARMLELGCASGGNLLPVADQYPNAALLGIDGSEKQIDSGRQLLEKAGLGNVELRCQNILDFTADKPFDYIIAHGVYSWVPDSVQRKILDIVRDHLSPRGVAYISYNTYPGWRMRGMIRDIMRYRASQYEEPAEQLAQARGLLTFLTNSVKAENNAYGLMLRSELESIGRADDSYLMHEHLEAINEPVYFHQFHERLKSHGLQYVGEADFGVMSLENFPDQVRGMLQSVARDRIELEQYMDFLRNRAFRQTIVTHANQRVDTSPNPQRLQRMRVASSAVPEGDSIDVRSSDSAILQRRGSKLTTTSPVVKAAMMHLQKAWPSSLPFTELAATSRSFIAGRPVPVDQEVMSDVSQSLAKTMLRCFATSMIDLHISEPSFRREPSDKPLASPLARAQASEQASATNRLHEHMALDDIQRFVLRRLDGQHDRESLVRDAAEAVSRGDLVLFQPDGRRLTSAQDAQNVLADLIPQVVVSLARMALLAE